MKLGKLALLVLAVLAGTALTVGAYVDSRKQARPTPWVHAACSLRSARLVVPERELPALPVRVHAPVDCPLRGLGAERRCRAG